MFCRECLVGYLRTQIVDFNARPCCPYINSDVTVAGSDHSAGSGCPFFASEADVRSLLSSSSRIRSEVGAAAATAAAAAVGGEEAQNEKLLKRYERVLVLSSHPEMRECPAEGCGHCQLPKRDFFLKRVRKLMVCEKCGLEYCFEVRVSVTTR
jgi:hypothetical protein